MKRTKAGDLVADRSMSRHRPSYTGTPPTTTPRVRIFRRPTADRVARASRVASLLAKVAAR